MLGAGDERSDGEVAMVEARKPRPRPFLNHYRYFSHWRWKLQHQIENRN